MVFEILETGRQSARTGQELCEQLHIKKRELGKIIEIERREGRPICSTSDSTNPGYYIAKDKAEMQTFCGSLRRRAGAIHRTRRACMATIDKLPEPKKQEGRENAQNSKLQNY